jgi:purine nucleosidase
VKPAILLDCDTGIDDVLALLYLASLVKAGDVELAAVGTVHGNVPPDVGAFNTLRVLERTGLSGVPVAVGATGPMAGQAQYAYDFHGTDGLGDINLPEPAGVPVEMSAPDQILRLARARPGELTLLAIGPLTNLGIALILDPSLAGLVRQVVVMGGALEYPGNVTSHAEANVWHDPEAAELVFGASWPLTLVPLDSTHPAAVDGAWLDRLAAGDTASAQLATQVLAFYVNAYRPFLDARGAVIHDALAAMLAVDPSLAEYVERPVRVELRGEHTRGATLWDGRRATDQDARPSVKVAVRTDVPAFQERLLTSLL